MTFVCVNCGCEIKELYKKYSASVIKLMNCESCHEVGDKYIEYDPNHWKLAIILLILESYFKWVTTDVSSVHRVFDHNVLRWEKSFYYMCATSIIELAVFYGVLMICAKVCGTLFKSRLYCDYFLLWKSVSLANFCIFFVIPWLVWEGIDSETYKWFIKLYMLLSQSKSFSVTQNITPLYSVFAVVFSYFLKSSVGSYIATAAY